MQRHEIIEIPLSELPEQPFVIRNASGTRALTQVSYDDKLLVEVSVQPKQTAIYTVSLETPLDTDDYAYGQMYAIRKDDIAWENDLCAYRVYGPALQRTGERSFGIDVWVKNTPELVVAARYAADFSGNIIEDSLRKIGKKEEAEYIDRITSFHIDHGNGMDVYGVGPSLGCGTPALMTDGKLKMPYCYTNYEILDNGPLRFSVYLEYEGGENRIISLDKGSHFNQMKVWFEDMPNNKNVSLAAGVVLHSKNDIITQKSYVCYADPTEESGHNSQIFVATLFPFNTVETRTINAEKPHALCILPHYKGEEVTYYFGAAWSNYCVRTLPEWQLRIETFIREKQNPLKINVKNN